MSSILLIGFMGSGKTTVGRELAKTLKMDFVDMDQVIERKEKKTIKEIFDLLGEPYFRNRERELFNKLVGRDRVVVASGGGIVESIDVNEIKKFDKVIFLHATKEDILKHTHSSERPLLTGNEDEVESKVEELLNRRFPMYDEAADIIIQTKNKKVKNICKEIIEIIT